jgi:hypothetical protein
MARSSFEKVVTECELVKAALESLLTDMPHLTQEHADLSAFLVDVKSLNTRQKELTGQVRQVTRQRRETALRGVDLRSRVAAQLRGKLGFKNEQLLKFGIPPRRKKHKKTQQPTGTPPPGGTPTPGTPPPAAK